MKNLLNLITGRILTVIILLFSPILYSQISYSNIELNNKSFREELELFIDELDAKYEKLYKEKKVISISIKNNEKNSSLNITVSYGLLSTFKNFKGILDMDYKGAIILISSEKNCINNFLYEKHPVNFSEKQVSPFVILYNINGLEIKYVSTTFPTFDNYYTYELKGGIYKLVSKKY